MTGAGESVAGLIRPGATFPWLYRKSVPFHVAGTSIRYWAAPMLPVSVVVVGDVLGNGLADGDAPVGDEHAAMSAMARTTIARRTDSDVRPRLPAVHRDACAVEKARLLRADERHHAGHLLHLSESSQRHLRAHERRDRLRVRLLPAVPAAALPQDRTRRDAVDGHALRRHLPGQRLDEADLRGLGGVVRRSST